MQRWDIPRTAYALLSLGCSLILLAAYPTVTHNRGSLFGCMWTLIATAAPLPFHRQERDARRSRASRRLVLVRSGRLSGRSRDDRFSERDDNGVRESHSLYYAPVAIVWR
jgi:hypothetical protein